MLAGIAGTPVTISEGAAFVPLALATSLVFALLICGWTTIRTSQRIVGSLFAFALLAWLNQMAFDSTSVNSLHGFASEGSQANGHYLVAYRGHAHEVPRTAFLFNLWYGRISGHALWILTLSCPVGFVLLARSQESAKRMAQGTPAEGQFVKAARYRAILATVAMAVFGVAGTVILFLGTIALANHVRPQAGFLLITGGMMFIASLCAPRYTRDLWGRSENLRRDQSICDNCGYSRRANPTAICPECGRVEWRKPPLELVLTFTRVGDRCRVEHHYVEAPRERTATSKP